MDIKSKKIMEHADICSELHELYVKKNGDYGDSVGQLYSKLGDITFFTRISDKYHRLENMLSNPDKSINYESMDDSIEDMANYCAIWLMERRIKRQKEGLIGEAITGGIITADKINAGHINIGKLPEGMIKFSHKDIDNINEKCIKVMRDIIDNETINK